MWPDRPNPAPARPKVCRLRAMFGGVRPVLANMCARNRPTMCQCRCASCRCRFCTPKMRPVNRCVREAPSAPSHPPGGAAAEGSIGSFKGIGGNMVRRIMRMHCPPTSRGIGGTRSAGPTGDGSGSGSLSHPASAHAAVKTSGCRPPLALPAVRPPPAQWLAAASRRPREARRARIRNPVSARSSSSPLPYGGGGPAAALAVAFDTHTHKLHACEMPVGLVSFSRRRACTARFGQGAGHVARLAWRSLPGGRAQRNGERPAPPPQSAWDVDKNSDSAYPSQSRTVERIVAEHTKGPPAEEDPKKDDEEEKGPPKKEDGKKKIGFQENAEVRHYQVEEDALLQTRLGGGKLVAERPCGQCRVCYPMGAVATRPLLLTTHAWRRCGRRRRCRRRRRCWRRCLRGRRLGSCQHCQPQSMWLPRPPWAGPLGLVGGAATRCRRPRCRRR